MANAKDLRQAISKCAEDAIRDAGQRGKSDKTNTFACYLSGWLGALGESSLQATLRQLLDLPTLPSGDGA